MSNVLDFMPGLLVDAATTPQALHALIRGRLTGAGYQVVAEDTSSVPCSLYVIPPSSETIGNSYARDVSLIRVAMASISVTPVTQSLVALPQVVAFFECDQAVLPGLSFGNGTTINGTNTGNPVSSLRTLYEALAASSDSYVSDWSWSWQPPAAQNANDSHSYILGRRKTLAAGDAAPTPTVIPLSGGDSTPSVFGGTAMSYAAAGIQPAALFAPATSFGIDLSSGFLLFLQISSRGLAIGARTSGAYNGLVHAVWGDHARALASMPTAAYGWDRWLSPIELVVGVDGPANALTSSGNTSHAWGVSNSRFNQVVAVHGSTSSDVVGAPFVHPFGGGGLRGIPHDYSLAANVSTPGVSLLAGGVADSGEGYVYDDYSVHLAKMQPQAIARANSGSASIAMAWGPIETSDWLKYYGTAPDENTQLWASPTPATTLATELARGGAEQTITLASTSGLPTSGTGQLETEWITWTGISGNNLTGCLRGRCGTEAQAHAVGEAFFLGQYGIKINGGLIACGATAPS